MTYIKATSWHGCLF